MSPSAGTSPDYLIIGHLSADRAGDDIRLGGTVAYAGLTAAALGLSVGAVTAAGTELGLEPLNGIRVQTLSSPESTSFHNEYQGTIRHQRLVGRAVDLDLEAVPEEWRTPKIVHLAPIADEVDPALASAFPDALVVTTPQGWMRRWDAEGVVAAKRWQNLNGTLPRAEIGIVSEEDLGGQADLLRVLLDRYHVLVVTSGASGVDVYRGGQREHVAPVPGITRVDPTGAGDIFAACFFVRYLETKDPLKSARFANQLAAISVERSGLAAIPTEREIGEVMQGTEA